MANNFIADSVIGAIDTVVKGAIRDLKYDQTIECIVISTDKAADGIYTVKSENASFDAYSASRYYVNDTVFVQIPKGDFNNQKFIIGRKVDREVTNKTFNLNLPFDNFIGLEKLTEKFTWNKDDQVYGFLANHNDGEESDETHGFDCNAASLIGSWELESARPVLTTKLAVSLDVQCLLADQYPLKGRYGICMEITGMSQASETSPSEEITQKVYFTNSDMYGDTYAYLLETPQQKIFDISELISLKRINIYFYQDFNFEGQTGIRIPYTNGDGGEELPPNIFLSNFDVYLGLTTDDIEDERVFLYTYDDVYYREGDVNRTLQFAWVHRDYENEQFVLVNTKELLNNYGGTIYWYRYDYGCQAPDDKDGAWKYAPINYRPIEREEDADPFVLTLDADPAKSREKYIAVVAFAGSYQRSQALTLTNVVDVETLQPALAAGRTYAFKFYRPLTSLEKLDLGDAYVNDLGEKTYIEDTNAGNFFVYDENSRAIKNLDGIRYSDIDYYAVLGILDKTGDTEVYKPLFSSDEDFEFDAEIDVESSSLPMITSIKLDNTDPIFGDKLSNKKYGQTILKFRINYFWDASYNQNAIRASITRNGLTYYVDKVLHFGQSGSTGSQYTVWLSCSPEKLQTGQNFEITAHVTDSATGSEIDSQNLRYKWSLIGGSQITESATSDTPKTFISEKTISGCVRNDIPPIFKVVVIGAADYPIYTKRGFSLYNDTNYIIYCPDRVEYKADGAYPIFDTSPFEATNEEGLRDYNVKWELEPADIKYFQLKSIEYSEQTLTSYDGSTQLRPAYTEYKMVSQINNEGTPWYWEPAMDTTPIYLVAKNDQGEVIARQGIALDQNVYSSSLVNNWDGSLSLDKENGAVLSTMISAGAKDNNNRFTGVMMGDWNNQGDRSLDIPGIYGIEKGVQTFGLKTDGSGFIGAAGQGQITFDGNQALISSADKNFYINLNPISVNNIWGRGYSEYFLYSKVPSFKPTSEIIDGSKVWYNKFMQDENNDYFIVHPSYGALTTGGIIARYGKIANWNIDKDGIYQKTDDSYFYIGHKEEVVEDDKSKIYDYAIYAGATPTNNGVTTNIPQFYVKWDGSAFMQSGKIANSWTINQNSLTYEKNSDTIYMGQAEDATQPYSIYAKSNGTVNFGLTPAGELFSQSGKIGGWEIGKTSLYSKIQAVNAANQPIVDDKQNPIYLSSIVFDTDKNELNFNQGSTIIGGNGTIILGCIDNNIMRGSVKIANTSIEGQSNQEIGKISVNQEDAKELRKEGVLDAPIEGSSQNEEGKFVYNYWGTQSNAIVYTFLNKEFYSEVIKTSASSGTYTAKDSLSFINQIGAGSIGCTISSGNIELPPKEEGGTSSALNMLIFQPYSKGLENKYEHWLGTSISPWNIYANTLICNNLQCGDGSISARSLYDNGERVATQLWVFNQLTDVYAQIKSAAGGSGNGIGGVIKRAAVSMKPLENNHGTSNMVIRAYNAEGGRANLPGDKDAFIPDLKLTLVGPKDGTTMNGSVSCTDASGVICGAFLLKEYSDEVRKATVTGLTFTNGGQSAKSFTFSSNGLKTIDVEDARQSPVSGAKTSITINVRVPAAPTNITKGNNGTYLKKIISVDASVRDHYVTVHTASGSYYFVIRVTGGSTQ